MKEALAGVGKSDVVTRAELDQAVAVLAPTDRIEELGRKLEFLEGVLWKGQDSSARVALLLSDFTRLIERFEGLETMIVGSRRGVSRDEMESAMRRLEDKCLLQMDIKCSDLKVELMKHIQQSLEPFERSLENAVSYADLVKILSVRRDCESTRFFDETVTQDDDITVIRDSGEVQQTQQDQSSTCHRLSVRVTTRTGESSRITNSTDVFQLLLGVLVLFHACVNN